MLNYDEIKTKYGHMASWAIWTKHDKSKKAKFGVGDISFFDNPETLKLKPNVVLCGLNISKKIEQPFANFHSSSSRSHDYKVRYALENTIFSGAYMTDIIKDFEKIVSCNVTKYLRKHPEFEKDNVTSFEKELSDIGSLNPVIICFGNDCFNIVKRNLKHKIYKVLHYSSCITKEELRNKFEDIINDLY
jgi:hypothetical protein